MKLHSKLTYIDSMRGPEVIALKDIEPKLRDVKTRVSNAIKEFCDGNVFGLSLFL